MSQRTAPRPFASLSNEELKKALDVPIPQIERVLLDEALTRRHELKPRYARYLDPRTGFFHHPLQVTHCIPGMALRLEICLEYAEAMYRKAKQDGDWEAAIYMHATAYQMDAFEKHSPKLDDATYWKTLARVWERQVNVREKKARTLRFFTAPRGERQALMTKGERHTLDCLPETFPVYRGFTLNRLRGVSWTLSKKTARKFAKSHGQYDEDRGLPRMAEAKAHKKDVLAYFHGRGQDEIVIDPASLEQPSVTWA